jgi:Cd2+/Zn2+-exporting ATPase
MDRVVSELLPQDKVGEVEALFSTVKEGEALAYIGDGINDAPVLMRADVGIAMGSLGSDAAIEAADVVVMDDDLNHISETMGISRKTVSIATENIVFALSVKLLILVLGALGIANMWAAVFADVGVAVLCILNSMRLLFYGRKKRG